MHLNLAVSRTVSYKTDPTDKNPIQIDNEAMQLAELKLNYQINDK